MRPRCVGAWRLFASRGVGRADSHADRRQDRHDAAASTALPCLVSSTYLRPRHGIPVLPCSLPLLLLLLRRALVSLPARDNVDLHRGLPLHAGTAVLGEGEGAGWERGEGIGIRVRPNAIVDVVVRLLRWGGGAGTGDGVEGGALLPRRDDVWARAGRRSVVVATLPHPTMSTYDRATPHLSTRHHLFPRCRAAGSRWHLHTRAHLVRRGCSTTSSLDANYSPFLFPDRAVGDTSGGGPHLHTGASVNRVQSQIERCSSSSDLALLFLVTDLAVLRWTCAGAVAMCDSGGDTLTRKLGARIPRPSSLLLEGHLHGGLPLPRRVYIA
ncbi:hypothetical protein B0H16DRAFT_775295 [Mycena metata]|uniref:Uncharacterized protein n=1 Tax=Mycena metata TaxID=1033252 RepID=A0AAD7J1I5_9AGAR|nr:hypothetical protein B0H16DRAFT_775295 [Mycena metata]